MIPACVLEERAEPDCVVIGIWKFPGGEVNSRLHDKIWNFSFLGLLSQNFPVAMINLIHLQVLPIKQQGN